MKPNTSSYPLACGGTPTAAADELRRAAVAGLLKPADVRRLLESHREALAAGTGVG